MTTVAITDLEEPEVSTICWGAVIAGAVASAALTLLLVAFGAGVGFSVISPWADQGVSMTTFHVGSGLFLIAIAMLSATVGGYLAGRLRTRWVSVHAHEVYFRDTAHGFMSWALATVISATLLGAATTSILSSTATGLIPAAGAGAAASASSATDPYVDTLLRADPATASPSGATPLGQNAPAQTADTKDPAATRAELARIMAPTLRKGGEISAADRTYVAKVISARTGIPQAEAEKRVNDTIVQAKQAADLHTPGFNQRVVWEVVRDGFLERHVPTIRARYRAQADAMAQIGRAHV